MKDLRLFLGPMFSGKTTEVVSALTHYRLGGCDCVLVKSAIDGRYSGADTPTVHTHEGVVAKCEPRQGRMGALRVVIAKTLAEIELAANETVVGVDEGQFFPDLRAAAESWADRRVFVSALDGDYLRQMFPSVAATVPLATHITKLRAVCMRCEGHEPVEAAFTLRLPGKSEEVIEVGGSEMYVAVCGACYAAAQ